ncbi:MAG: hypothetical protein SOV16_09725 [Anaerobiospirillum succiniciproducens]|uniref:hypothetical protein n=1 Tax=Anaerobiospirillum succiniciproducens TaxID=13335 RepID=UPI002A74A0BC|nr:hypothetical protein [Anaerobiospirillum succiniciproducens]MDY2799419.1 hypothetical protein [Anaerobiospirillum succiniciproducens]
MSYNNKPSGSFVDTNATPQIVERNSQSDNANVGQAPHQQAIPSAMPNAAPISTGPLGPSLIMAPGVQDDFSYAQGAMSPNASAAANLNANANAAMLQAQYQQAKGNQYGQQGQFAQRSPGQFTQHQQNLYGQGPGQMQQGQFGQGQGGQFGPGQMQPGQFGPGQMQPGQFGQGQGGQFVQGQMQLGQFGQGQGGQFGQGQMQPGQFGQGQGGQFGQGQANGVGGAYGANGWAGADNKGSNTDEPIGTPQEKLKLAPESYEARANIPMTPVAAYAGGFEQASKNTGAADMGSAVAGGSNASSSAGSARAANVASDEAMSQSYTQTMAYAAATAKADANAAGYSDELRTIAMQSNGQNTKSVPLERESSKIVFNGNTQQMANVNDPAAKAMAFSRTYEGARLAVEQTTTPYDDLVPKLYRIPSVRPGMSPQQAALIERLQAQRARFEHLEMELKIRFQMLLADPDTPDYPDDEYDDFGTSGATSKDTSESAVPAQDSGFVQDLRQTVTQDEDATTHSSSRPRSPIEMLLRKIEQHTGINIDDIEVRPGDAELMRRRETIEVAAEVRKRKEDYYRRFVKDMKRSGNVDSKYNFATLNRDKFNNDAFTLSLRFISNIYPQVTPQMLLVFGDMGTGKTCLCHAIGNKFMQLRTHSKTEIGRHPDVPLSMLTTFDDIKKTWFYSNNESFEDKNERNRRFNAFCNTDLLILDGLCSDNSALDPFAQKIFNELLRRRSSQGLPMVITTAVNLQSIHKAIGDLCYEGIKSFSVTATCLFGRSRRPYIRFNGSYLP